MSISARLDGASFYRAMHVGAAGPGLIQGGCAHRSAPLLPADRARADQRRPASSISTARSSVPRGALGTAQGRFHDHGRRQHYLDAGSASTGDELGYAVFGRVVEGMDVVRRILAAPTSPTEGEGTMRGQMLAPRIRILTRAAGCR